MCILSYKSLRFTFLVHQSFKVDLFILNFFAFLNLSLHHSTFIWQIYSRRFLEILIGPHNNSPRTTETSQNFWLKRVVRGESSKSRQKRRETSTNSSTPQPYPHDANPAHRNGPYPNGSCAHALAINQAIASSRYAKYERGLHTEHPHQPSASA